MNCMCNVSTYVKNKSDLLKISSSSMEPFTLAQIWQLKASEMMQWFYLLSSIFLWQSKRREKNEHETFLPWQRNFRGISLNVECMWISALIDSMKEHLVRKLISHRLGSMTFLLVFPLLWEIFQNIISNKKSTLLEITWEKEEWSSACLGRYVYCTYCTMQIYF